LHIFSSDDSPAPALDLLPLHDALPIWGHSWLVRRHNLDPSGPARLQTCLPRTTPTTVIHTAFALPPVPSASTFAVSRVLTGPSRSEEHTSELQSLTNIVCRLLLGKNNH